MSNKNTALFKRLRNKKNSDLKSSIKKLAIVDLLATEEGYKEDSSVNFITRVGGQLFQFYSLRGEEWSEGAKGVKGLTGGKGLTAYQEALLEGFIGSELEWRASLNGSIIPSIDISSFKESYLESFK